MMFFNEVNISSHTLYEGSDLLLLDFLFLQNA